VATSNLANSPSSTEAEAFRTFNSNLIHELCELGDRLLAEHRLLPKSEPPKPDPLTVALGGFPDVHTYYAHQVGKSIA
jgi:hypothetical protein